MPTFDTVASGFEPIAAYQTLFELGRGGMGTVWLSRATGAGGFERLVVVKRLNRELVGKDEAVRRFLDEARHAALIHHANVVGIHQIGQDGEGYFLVLDYVEGGTLEELTDRAAIRRERIPPPIVLRIGLDALAGLSAAHNAVDAAGTPLQLLHRDVSLQNVLVGRDGVSRLADFGIAKSTLASVATDQKYLMGKLLYAPPEYLKRKPVGPSLDIYALGMTLWIALAGRDPWPDDDESQLVLRICQEGVPSLADAAPPIAPQLDALVARACDPEPSRRFASAREMADAVESIGRQTGWVASHAEVAAYLEASMGVDLQRRRELVQRSVTAARQDPSAAHRSAPPPAGEQPERTGASRSRTTGGLEIPMSGGAGPLRYAFATLLVGAGVGAVVYVSRPTAGPVASPSAEAPPASAGNGASPSSRAPDVPSPSTTASGAVSSAPPVLRRPPRAKVAPRGGALAPPQTAPAPPPAEPSPPDSIRKTNPYR